MTYKYENYGEVWEYRMVLTVHPKKPNVYDIREVYYGVNNNIVSISPEPSFPFGDSEEDLITDMGKFYSSLNKPLVYNYEAY